MPRRGNVAAVLVLVLTLLQCGTAQAGMPIPCTGEVLVKVLDIPALQGTEIAANRDLPEKRLDLGYLFKGCLDGEWVGHIGHESRYAPLTEKQLEHMLASVGRDHLPPVPSFWSARENALPFVIWGLLISLFLLASVVQWLKRVAPGDVATDWSASIDQAARAYGAPTKSGGYSRPAASVTDEQAAPRASSGGARSARAGAFGKRALR